MYSTDIGTEPTSVHALELSVETLLYALSATQRRLLGPRLGEQCRVIMAVAASDPPGAERRAARINCCCQCVSVGTSAVGVPAVRMHRCRDRLCQICQRYRRIQTTERVLAMVRSMTSPKLLTLTLADDGAPLSDRLDRLVASYRRLRQRTIWSANVEGAAAVMEITRGQSNRHWHVHLHVLIDAEYIPQHVLSAEWFAATGDSPIVDIRAVHSGEQAAKYLAKYAAKGTDTGALTLDLLIEYVDAMHRRRTLITSGSMHNRPADTDDWEPRHEPVDEPISVPGVVRAAEQGSVAARDVLRMMARAGGLASLFASRHVGDVDAITEEVWLKLYRREWIRCLKHVREWLQRHGPGRLPRPAGVGVSQGRLYGDRPEQYPDHRWRPARTP